MNTFHTELCNRTSSCSRALFPRAGTRTRTCVRARIRTWPVRYRPRAVRYRNRRSSLDVDTKYMYVKLWYMVRAINTRRLHAARALVRVGYVCRVWSATQRSSEWTTACEFPVEARPLRGAEQRENGPRTGEDVSVCLSAEVGYNGLRSWNTCVGTLLG